MQRNVKRYRCDTSDIVNDRSQSTGERRNRVVCARGCLNTCKCYWRQLNQLEFMKVPRIHANDPNAAETVQLYRMAGIPCIVHGQQGWASFAYPWLRRQKDAQHSDSCTSTSSSPCVGTTPPDISCEVERSTSPVTTVESPIHVESEADEDDPILSLDEGPFDLNIAALKRDIGNEVVPVITPDYDETAPLKTFVPVHRFMDEAWMSKEQNWYLHQWQFPLSSSARATLCYKTSSLAVLGFNMLNMWYDPLLGDCPFQYLFMGREDTFSRLHKDKGGLTILLAPIIGEKEVILVHREDTHRLYHCRAGVYKPDFAAFPLSSLIRSWKVVIGPGDILIMPANTYHAARNLSPCLSYSRFHLDEVNLPMFVQSFLDVDCASMPQALMIWNMTYECMKVVEHAHDQEKQVCNYIRKRKCGEDVSPTTSVSTSEERDFSFHPSPQRAYVLLCKFRHIIQAILQDRGSSIACAITPCAEPSNDVSTEDWLKLRKDLDETIHEYNYRACATVPPLKQFHDNPTLLKVRNDIPVPVALSTNAQPPDESEVQIETAAEDERAIAQCLSRGLFVKVSRCQKLLEAKVLQVQELDAVLIHYEGWPRYYDEYRPLQQLRHLDEATVEKLTELNVGTGVLAQWGSGNDSYRAIVLALYRGPLVRVRFTDLESDWNQWVRPLNITQ